MVAIACPRAIEAFASKSDKRYGKRILDGFRNQNSTEQMKAVTNVRRRKGRSAASLLKAIRCGLNLLPGGVHPVKRCDDSQHASSAMPRRGDTGV